MAQVAHHVPFARSQSVVPQPGHFPFLGDKIGQISAMGTSSFCGLEGGKSRYENSQPVQPKAAGEKEPPEEELCEYKMIPDQQWQGTT